MEKKMTIDEFFGKLDWEDGYPGLASYGLHPTEIANKKLAKLWLEYKVKFAEADAIAEKIEKMRPPE